MPHKPRKKTTYVPEKATIPAVNKPPNCGRKRYVSGIKRGKKRRKKLTMLGYLVLGAETRAAV